MVLQVKRWGLILETDIDGILRRCLHLCSGCRVRAAHDDGNSECCAGPAQVKDEAVAIASKCNADIRVSSLATDSAAVQRDILLRIGQIVVSTPGQVAQVSSQCKY